MSSIISIIVPCYNQAFFLDQSLQSVLEQTYIHWECIIINDGSKDKTEEIAKKWINKDNRFKYFFKKNGGLSSARNFGLEKATGNFIQFLDADDLLHPKKIECQLNDLHLKDISIADYFPFLDNDTNIRVPNRYLSPFLSEIDFKKEIILDWEYKKSIPCHSVLFKKELLDKHQLNFDESLQNHEDWVFWTKLFYYANGIKNNKNVLALYRIHKNGMSLDFIKMKQGFLKATLILNQFFKKEGDREFQKLTKIKYKEIYKKGRRSIFRKIKAKLARIYHYATKY